MRTVWMCIWMSIRAGLSLMEITELLRMKLGKAWGQGCVHISRTAQSWGLQARLLNPKYVSDMLERVFVQYYITRCFIDTEFITL